MSKKLLSVLLAILMVVSSVSCLFTMSIITASAEDGNLMANTKASDWISGWNGNPGTELNGEISVSAAWRSVYTTVTLEPETEYDLTFKFGQTRVGDVRVYPASEITDPATQLISVGSAPTAGGTTNLASDSITCSITSGTPVDGEFYEASESFTTTTETEYYVILDCYQCVDSKNSVLLKDFYLGIKPEAVIDPNTDAVDPANWDSGRESVSFASAEGKNGAAGVTVVGNPIWVDSFAKLTLEPNTAYNLSFSYKGATKISNLYVLAVNDSTYESGDHVCTAINDGASPVLTKKTSDYTYSADAWTDISASFTTNSNSEYYLILCHDGTAGGFTVSDFNFEKLTVEQTITDPAYWSSVRSGTVSFTAAEGKDGTAGVATTGNLAWVDSYVKFSLEPNTDYTLSFSYKGATVVSNMFVLAVNDCTYESGTHLCTQIKDGASPVLKLSTGSYTYSADTWTDFTLTFTTNSNSEYYLIFDHGAGTTGYAVSNFNIKKLTAEETIVNPTNWKSTRSSVTFASAEGKDGTAGVATSGNPSWVDTYAKFSLEPNTDYELSFSYKGATAISNILVLAVNDSAYTSGTHICNVFNEGASPVLKLSAGSYTYSADTWTDFTLSFTTNSNTEYYMIFDHGAGTTGYAVSNFSVKKPTVEDVIATPASWNSVRSGTVSFTAAEGKDGTAGVATTGNLSWVDSYAKFSLEPNTDYTLSFSYKGATVVSNMYILAVNDCTYESGTHLCTQIKDGATPALKLSTGSYTYSADTWTDFTLSFTTNSNSEYYLIFDHGAGETGYAVSNFSITASEADKNVNVLENTVATDWTSSWSGRVGTYEKVIAVKNAWRSAYTKVTLEPYTIYDFTFKASTVKVRDIRVYAASEITDVEAQLKNSGDWATGGTNDLTTAFSTTAPEDDYASATADLVNKYYDVTASFATGAETEYYILVDGSQFLNNSDVNQYCTFTHLKNLNLVATGEVYIDPNVLLNATVANGDVRFSVGADSEDYYITGVEGTEDENVTYTNSEGEEVTRNRVYYYDSKTNGNYSGGYAWRIILSSDTAMAVYNPAVYGYITASGLAADTTYTFSYIYSDTYHIKLADVYNDTGSVVFSDVNTTILPDKNSTQHFYMVTANFTTDAEGDYVIKLQTGRSNKYYIYDASSWALTLSDLSLVEYVEQPEVETPADDANLLENPEEFNWGTTWYDVTVSDNTVSTAGIHHHGIYTSLDGLAPNTEYILTFKYKSRAAIDTVGVVPVENTNLANINDKFSSTIIDGKGSLVYYSDIGKVIDATTLNTAEVKFVTTDSTAYYLYFEGDSDANAEASGNTVISDISLTKNLDTAAGKKVDYDFEDGNTGVISTTSGSDKPSIITDGDNNYLRFTRVNDGITIPFYYNAGQRYIVSFDVKVLTAPADSTVQLGFRTSAEDNNPLAGAGNVFVYNNNAYGVVTKDMNGEILSTVTGLNNGGDGEYDYQFNGYKQDIENTDWVHYEITLDPDYTYYTGLANFGFNAEAAGWSIALDNIKVTALDDTFEQNAKDNFTPVQYAAIRKRIADQRQGIRVKSSIDTSLLSGDIKVVEYGTLAIKNEILAGKELIYDMVNSDTYNAKIGVAYSSDSGENIVFETNGSVVTYTGVLVGITDYTTDYAVRGYMIAETADGERFVIYEDDTKTVSVYDVVYAILADGTNSDDVAVAEAIVAKNETAYNTFVEENYPEETITASKTVTLSINNATDPVIENYRGFSGTVYHAFGFMEDDATGRVYDEDMINTELDRLEDAGVHYVRTRFQSQWIFDDATGYDWNSDRLNYFFNYAKAMQERDIEVILQVGWHFDFISRQENATYSIYENDYFCGDGNDLYGESAGFDLTKYTDEDDIRIVKAANRYAYMMAKLVAYAKANGVNNINYFSYFVEPSNSYSVSDDGTILDKINLKAGHDAAEYVLFCRTMRNTLEGTHGLTGIKHMGPNEASYSKLISYVLENDPTLFDIITAHNYPEEDDVATNYKKYYETMTNNQNSNVLNGYMTDFNDYAGFLATAQQSNPSAEFWSDEFNIKDFDAYEGRGTSSFYRGLATAMGGIVAQQSGIQNTILWMSFDQLWTDKSGTTVSNESEFINGIHQCGNAPSLFLSDQPYEQYYPTSLFSRYNGYKNGKVYATNLTETQTEGVYVGAVQLEDGSWTVSVVNMNSTAVNISVAFDTAINQTLYRHMVSAAESDTYADAKLPDADKTFTNVATSFTDVLPAGSFAVYTGVQG